MYSILQSKEGEFMLIFCPSLGEYPEFSFFIYDDSVTAWFQQGLFYCIRVNDILPETLSALYDVTGIHVVEKASEEITSDCLAAFKIVSGVRPSVL